LLYQLDILIAGAPKFHIAKDSDGNVIGEPIGVPVYLLFDLLSNTSAGYDLFRKPAFNAATKKLLDSWGAYLSGPGSNSTLTNDEEGWFSEAGMKLLEDKNRGQFDATYVCPQPNEVNRGYQTWDEFFIREFQPGVRRILEPTDQSLVISACESTPYRIQTNVQLHDQFWLKAQKYSLYDMLNRDEATAKSFVGGTVYQAFLSPADYHRWHAPIDGVIKDVHILPGNYYAALPDAGADQDDPDLQPGDPHGALVRSQGWLTHTAARTLIYIQGDNPDIGLIVFIGVGMGEVSTCTPTVQPGQRVKKGDEIGAFHFGGSTHALIFGPQAKLRWTDDVVIDQHVKMHTTIAKVEKA
jgi:phosphatidylserine decarboxylase